MKLGKTQTLHITDKTDHGLILEDKEGNKVLLPNKETENLQVGEDTDVFIYLDSEDRLIATKKEPKIQLGEIKPLEVISVNKIGAFLDWGLDKDLLLPFSNQIGPVQQGKEVLVQLYEDKTGRLASTMSIYEDLKTDSPYKKGDWVEGFVYQINPKFGAFLAVDDQYSGMIPTDLLDERIKNGERVKARVMEVRKDGRLTLSPNKISYKKMVPDAQLILETLQESENGFIPFNDKSSPEEIKAEFDISKGAFKRALGYLLKRGLIRQTGNGIELRNV